MQDAGPRNCRRGSKKHNVTMSETVPRCMIHHSESNIMANSDDGVVVRVGGELVGL